MKLHGSPAVYTVGHSNRQIDEFISLLKEQAIERVIDVRKLPGSAKYPQFNEDALRDSLHSVGIELQRVEALTGRRPVSMTVPFETNGWWQNRSFHNYADHALSQEFRAEIAALVKASESVRLAVMCAEAVWWRCHRRIITDYLLSAGCHVVHIMGPGRQSPAARSEGAQVTSGVNGVLPEVTYPQQ